MATDTKLDSLVINYLTQAQYNNAKREGTLNSNQIYMTPASSSTYTLPAATSSTLGGVKLSDSTSSASSTNGGIAATPAAVKAAIAGEKAEMLVVAAATEADIAELESYEERQMFLEDLGLEESGVARLIKSAYKLLNLETFFTTGADESRAWTYVRGMKAPQTAGIIHTDFEKGFIRAEVIKYDDYVALGSEKACRDAGKIGIEGKEYVVQDGDIMHFLFNV